MPAAFAFLVLSGLVAPAAAQEAPAQQPVSQRIDRIVAIVGTRPILASQLEEELVQQQAQGRQLPTDSAARAALRRQLLDQIIELELLVQQEIGRASCRERLER